MSASDMTTQVSTIAASSQAIAEKTTSLMSTLDSSQTVITDHRASFFLKNTNISEVEASKDTPNSSVKLSSSHSTKKLSAIPISTSRAQSLRPNLPFVKIIHAPSVTLARSLRYDVEDTCPNGIAVELSMMQCVDNSTQTDTLHNKGQIFLKNKVAEQFGVNVEVKREYKNQKENRKQNSMLNEICEVNDGVLAIALDRKNENDIEKNLVEDENYVLFREIDFLDMKSVCSRGNDETTSEIKSPIGCDNSFKKPINVLEIEQSSINSDNIFECKTHSSSESFLESVECTCNAATQFNCDCDPTIANCTYQERIIDYDNFRIIEHVIDCAHESYCKHGEKMKCDTSWNETEEENKEKNKEINLSCRELVAFIGESYQIINNEHHSIMQNQEQTDKPVASSLILDTHHSSNDNDKKDIYCSSDADDIMDSQFTNTNLDENLDNNNNKGHSEGVAQSFNGTKNQPPDSNKQAIGTTNSVSIECHAQTEPSKRSKQQSISTIQNSTPSMALALKALKSKLTPLAPSFHPARIKSQPTSSTTNASSSMYAYEQTAIYYQQEPQLPKSQLPCLQQSATTTTVQKTNLHQYPQLQEEQQHQIQVVPMVQSSYSKSYFQRQHNPSSLVQNLQQAHNFLISSNEHSHHGDGLANLPQTHLNSSPSATTAAIPSSTLPMAAANPTQQTQLYPVQMISLATPTLTVDASKSIGQQQQACTTSTVIATVGNGSTPWPLLEATPVFIDSHGEFHTFCPTHGHAALNTVSVETVASPQCVPFNQTTLSSTRRNISQSKHFQNPLQHQTPVASTKINSTNHLMVQNAKVNNQNYNKNQNHQPRHQQHPQQHQLHYHQQQQKLDTSAVLNISGKGKLYGGK